MPMMPPPNSPADTDAALKWADTIQRTMSETAKHVGMVRVQLQKDIEELLISEGLDGGTKAAAMIGMSDAKRTARAVCRPLAIFEAEARNSSKTMRTFRSRLQVRVCDAIAQVRASRKTAKSGFKYSG